MAINGFLTTRAACAAIFMTALLTWTIGATARPAEAMATSPVHAHVRMARVVHRGLTIRDGAHAAHNRCARGLALVATVRGYPARASSRHPRRLTMGGAMPERIGFDRASAMRGAVRGQAGTTGKADVIDDTSVRAIAEAALATPLVSSDAIGGDDFGVGEGVGRSDCTVAGMHAGARPCTRSTVAPTADRRRLRSSISAEYP